MFKWCYAFLEVPILTLKEIAVTALWTTLAILVYFVVFVAAFVSRRSLAITSGGVEHAIENPFLRAFVLGGVLLPLAGIILVVVGAVCSAVGKFLLLPFVNLF